MSYTLALQTALSICAGQVATLNQWRVAVEEKQNGRQNRTVVMKIVANLGLPVASKMQPDHLSSGWQRTDTRTTAIVTGTRAELLEGQSVVATGYT